MNYTSGLNTYIAVRNEDGTMRITSVTAENEAEGRRELRRQLSKPGRRHILKTWVDNGAHIIAEPVAVKITFNNADVSADDYFAGFNWLNFEVGDVVWVEDWDGSPFRAGVVVTKYQALVDIVGVPFNVAYAIEQKNK